MRKIEINELKKLELDILIEIDEICTKNNFRYSLAYGTLIGAVRHKGFIPWDDDIDIFLPRPDYNKFVDYCSKNKTIFKLLSYDNSRWYSYPFAKATNRNTVIEEEETDFNGKMGIYVDVFPLDGLGDTYNDAKRNFLKSEIYRDLIFTSHWKKFFLSKTKSWYIEPIRFIFFILSRLVNAKNIIKRVEKIYTNREFNQNKYIGCLYTPYRLKDVMPKNIFDEYIDIVFEGRKFKCIKEYDDFLTRIYGNYMQLPPKDRQKTHHLFKAYYKD